MAPSRTRCIGMEGHTESMAVASGASEHGAEVPSLGSLGTRQCDSDPLLRTRPSQGKPLVFVSAAGPCGSWLCRSLTKQADACWVVASARMPQKAGDRVHTDRRAAVPLARLARSGERTAVSVPKGEDAALRALPRAREETLRALQDATCCLNAFWLSHDLRSTGRAKWRPAPLRWRSAVGCPTPAPHIVCPADGRAVHEPTAHLQRLEPALQEHVTSWRVPPVVEALQALRGVPCTVAVPRVAAIGALSRFDPPRARMQLLGLLPSAYASGERRQQGAITKAGNPQARRALVAGAWASRSAATVSRPLPLRREQPPQLRQASSWQAQGRLWKRSRRLMAKGNHATVGTVAMAREWVGVMWASAQEMPVTASGQKPEAPLPPHADSCLRAWAEPPPRGGVTRDGVRSPLGPTRAEREAGTRRTPGRWEPTHGEQPDQASHVTGSGSSDARREKNL